MDLETLLWEVLISELIILIPLRLFPEWFESEPNIESKPESGVEEYQKHINKPADYVEDNNGILYFFKSNLYDPVAGMIYPEKEEQKK